MLVNIISERFANHTKLLNRLKIFTHALLSKLLAIFFYFVVVSRIISSNRCDNS